MPRRRLPKRAERYFIQDVLEPNWLPSGAVGYDLAANPGDEAFLPSARSLEQVGEVYPHLTVLRSNESAGGETTYDAVTPSGPAQTRDGQFVVTARAEAGEYTGDSAVYPAVDAETVVDDIIATVEDVCIEAANAPNTAFSYLGSDRGADAPDDYDASPPVFVEQCVVAYSWLRE